MTVWDYERDGQRIYELSFSTIRSETNLERFSGSLEQVVVRVVHAAGDPAVAALVAASKDVVESARSALRAGADILTDSMMLASGITPSRLPASNRVVCTLRHHSVPELAAQNLTTRSAAAVDLWLPNLEGSVVAIGNAPTALFRLLELIENGAPRPAAILGVPVGFVGAAESKEALVSTSHGVPYFTVLGRRGGSAMAAAAVNAIASTNE